MLGHFFKQILQVTPYIDMISLCRFNHRIHQGIYFGTKDCISEKPIGSSHGVTANNSFDMLCEHSHNVHWTKPLARWKTLKAFGIHFNASQAGLSKSNSTSDLPTVTPHCGGWVRTHCWSFGLEASPPYWICRIATQFLHVIN